jgi:hypothetical protein
MLLRRFTQLGVDRFRGFVVRLRNDKTLVAPREMLEDDALTEVISPPTECPDATFGNRLVAAEYLDRLLTPVGLADALHDVGLWSWLALRFFDQLRPLGTGINLQKLGVEEARFIPTDNYTDRHRHLLRTPLRIYRAARGNPQNVMCFLVQPVHQPGDLNEQFTSRDRWMRNAELIATLNQLVVDAASNTIRRNASARARRLSDVLDQFDCTWDLGFIAKDLLVPMLPAEFKELHSRGAGAQAGPAVAETT